MKHEILHYGAFDLTLTYLWPGRGDSRHGTRKYPTLGNRYRVIVRKLTGSLRSSVITTFLEAIYNRVMLLNKLLAIQETKFLTFCKK